MSSLTMPNIISQSDSQLTSSDSTSLLTMSTTNSTGTSTTVTPASTCKSSKSESKTNNLTNSNQCNSNSSTASNTKFKFENGKSIPIHSPQSSGRDLPYLTTASEDDPIARMEKALEAFGTRGEMVMVMDSADREDECDLIIAAEKCTVEQMAFMIKHSTGIICLTTTKERLQGFGLHPATTKNTDPNGTNFYVSTDYLEGTTTGVSAHDRLKTLQAFTDPTIPPEKFSKPGHMFPLCSNPNGVLARQGHTESTFDFCRLAEGVKHPVGALAELMHEDGTMFREGDSRSFAEEHKLQMVYVSDIIAYRKKMEKEMVQERVERFGMSREGTPKGALNSIGGESKSNSEKSIYVKKDVTVNNTNTVTNASLTVTEGEPIGNTKSESELDKSKKLTENQIKTSESSGKVNMSSKINDITSATSEAQLRIRQVADECRILVTKSDKAIADSNNSNTNTHDPSESSESQYKTESFGDETVLLIKGDPTNKQNVPVRIHSECFTGDTFRSLLCDCGTQLDSFLAVMDKHPHAVLVYMRGHEGRGIGLFHKIRAYRLQRVECLDTVEANKRLGFAADLRNFDKAVESLVNLNIGSIELYSNNPDKLHVLQQAFEGRIKNVPLPSVPNPYNIRYLETKQLRQGHLTVLSEFDPLSKDRKNSKGTTITTVNNNTDSVTVESTIKTSVVTESERNRLSSPVTVKNQNYITVTDSTVEPMMPTIPAKISKNNQDTVIILSTSWNEELVKPIVSVCKDVLLQEGNHNNDSNDSEDSDSLNTTTGNRTTKTSSIKVLEIEVPGVSDLLQGTRAVLRKYRPSAVICIGIYVTDVTPEGSSTVLNQSNAVFHELHALAGRTDIPIIQGISACNKEHAIERSQVGSPENPGRAYGLAAIKMMKLMGDMPIMGNLDELRNLRESDYTLVNGGSGAL